MSKAITSATIADLVNPQHPASVLLVFAVAEGAHLAGQDIQCSSGELSRYLDRLPAAKRKQAEMLIEPIKREETTTRGAVIALLRSSGGAEAIFGLVSELHTFCQATSVGRAIPRIPKSDNAALISRLNRWQTAAVYATIALTRKLDAEAFGAFLWHVDQVWDQTWTDDGSTTIQIHGIPDIEVESAVEEILALKPELAKQLAIVTSVSQFVEVIDRQEYAFVVELLHEAQAQNQYDAAGALAYAMHPGEMAVSAKAWKKDSKKKSMAVTAV